MVEKFINSKWTKFLFALSVMVFVGLQIGFGSRNIVILNILIAFALALFMEYRYKVLGKLFEIKSKKYVFISLPIATYTVIEIGKSFYSRWLLTFFSEYARTGAIIHNLGASEQFLSAALFMFSVLAGIVALFAVFAVVYAIVSRFKKFAVMVWQGIEKLERVYLIATVSIFSVFIAVVYSLSPIFWGDNTLPLGGIDFIFDFDVGNNIEFDAQFFGTRFGNIRRLYYPLVNLPFALAARALGRILFFIPLAYIYFLQVFHIALMACGGILLARMCNITGFSKKYFLVLYTISYPFLVFSIPLERYILPTFCVILLMYISIHAPKAKFVATLAAAGTLTTSVAVLPFVAYNRKIKTWILNFFKLGSGVVAISILSGMLSIIYNPIRSVLRDLNSFAGGVSTGEKSLQFINFVGSIFVRPETTLRYRRCPVDDIDFLTYALAPPVSVNWIAVLLILFAIVGFIANRQSRIAQISFLWVAFAFFALFVMGWQARENEMFLSSLYFGWAFFVLVFMFLEKLLENHKTIKYAMYSAILIVMAVININGIIELVQFGIQHYPAR